VLAKLHQNRLRFTRFADALPWLRTVADNACRDQLRRTARRKRREETRAVSEREELRIGERAELQEMLTVALAKLSPQYRDAIALVFFEGMERQAAAALLGVNRDTLAKRIGEALGTFAGVGAGAGGACRGWGSKCSDDAFCWSGGSSSQPAWRSGRSGGCKGRGRRMAVGS